MFKLLLVPILKYCFCILLFRKPLHPTLLDEKPKTSKFSTDLKRKNRCLRTWIQLSLWMLINGFICYDRTKTDGGPRRDRKDAGRGRGPRDRGRGRGRPEVIQSHSIFEQGPAEMMMKKRGRRWPLNLYCWCFYYQWQVHSLYYTCLIVSCFKCVPLSHTGGYENEKEAPSLGPSPIINIKKEKRETEEETKEILAKLERDNVSPLVFIYLYFAFVFNLTFLFYCISL